MSKLDTDIVVTDSENVVDDHNRVLVENMSSADKLDEIVLTMRAIADALESLQSNPMLKAFIPAGLGL